MAWVNDPSFPMNRMMRPRRSGGIRQPNPTASVRNPGVSKSAPATSRKIPSTIATAGISPASMLLRTCRIVENPWARTSAAPAAAVSTTRPMVGTAPMIPPTSSSR